MNTEHQLDNLRNLAEKKEKEWREICELRMTSLEAKVKERDEQLDEEKIRFKKIKNDFEYNLKLLEERDKELETYDNIFEGMKGLKNEKNAEISELKIRLVEAKEKQKHLQKEKEELQKYYQQVYMMPQGLTVYRLGLFWPSVNWVEGEGEGEGEGIAK